MSTSQKTACILMWNTANVNGSLEDVLKTIFLFNIVCSRIFAPIMGSQWAGSALHTWNMLTPLAGIFSMSCCVHAYINILFWGITKNWTWLDFACISSVNKPEFGLKINRFYSDYWDWLKLQLQFWLFSNNCPALVFSQIIILVKFLLKKSLCKVNVVIYITIFKHIKSHVTVWWSFCHMNKGLNVFLGHWIPMILWLFQTVSLDVQML